MVAGKSALVTGGGSGIGEATATLLAIEGARVAVVDRDGDAATRVAAAIQEAGGTSIALEVDVTDQTAVAAMVDAVVGEFGRLDIAHNNAGISGTPSTFHRPRGRRVASDAQPSTSPACSSACRPSCG